MKVIDDIWFLSDSWLAKALGLPDEQSLQDLFTCDDPKIKPLVDWVNNFQNYLTATPLPRIDVPVPQKEKLTAEGTVRMALEQNPNLSVNDLMIILEPMAVARGKNFSIGSIYQFHCRYHASKRTKK